MLSSTFLFFKESVPSLYSLDIARNAINACRQFLSSTLQPPICLKLRFNDYLTMTKHYFTSRILACTTLLFLQACRGNLGSMHTNPYSSPQERSIFSREELFGQPREVCALELQSDVNGTLSAVVYQYAGKKVVIPSHDIQSLPRNIGIQELQKALRNGLKPCLHRRSDSSYRLDFQPTLLGGMREMDRKRGELATQEIPQEYLCPITQEVMTDPVMAADGHSYERGAITKWFELGRYTSPLTGARLAHRTLTPNHALRKIVEEFQNKLATREREQRSSVTGKQNFALPQEELAQGYVDMLAKEWCYDSSKSSTWATTKNLLPRVETLLKCKDLLDPKRYTLLAGIISGTGDYHYVVSKNCDKALACYQEALKMYKALYKTQAHSSVAGILNRLGNVYFQKKQYEEALQYYKASLGMRKMIYAGQVHPKLADTLSNVGMTYYQKKSYTQALQYVEDSLKMRRRLYNDKHHPDVARSLYYLGDIHQRKGKQDQALKCYEESLVIYSLVHKFEANPNTVRSMLQVGKLHLQKGHNKVALEHYQGALKMLREIHKNRAHRDVAVTCSDLGLVYVQSRNYTEALKCYEESLKIYRTLHQNRANIDVAVALYDIGKLYALQQKRKEAISYYEQAYQMCLRCVGADHSITKKIKARKDSLQSQTSLLPVGIGFLALSAATIAFMGVFRRK